MMRKRRFLRFSTAASDKNVNDYNWCDVIVNVIIVYIEPQIYIYKYLDTGLLFPSVAIFDPVKLTSSALTHAHACAPAKLVVYI